MTPKQRIKHGNAFPFDASDRWWQGDGKRPPPPPDAAHATARGVIADMQDRRGIKHGFDGIDEDVRVQLVKEIAAIIREGMK